MSQDADRPPRRGRLPMAAAYGLTLALVAAATVVAILFDQLTPTPNLSLIFVLPVVIAAVSFGWRESMTAAVLGALAFNFFLIPPLYTLRIAGAPNVWAMVLLLAVAALVSAVAAQARRRAEEALAVAEQGVALRALARSLVGATLRTDIGQTGANALAHAFGVPAAVLIDDGQGFEVFSAGGAPPGEADIEAARWSLASRLAGRAGEYPVEAAGFDFWPVVTGQRQGFVLGVRFAGLPDGRPEGVRRLVDTVAGYISVALDREYIASRALRTQVEMAGQRLKGDLLAAVSHDLKTPLSTILLTLQSLRKFDGQHNPAARLELMGVAERETERLSAMVSNLLDMGRLEADAVPVRCAPIRAADLLSGGLGQASLALSGHEVVREPGGDSVVFADAGLAETALANLLQNAGKYAPSGSAIRVRLGHDAEVGWVEVEDEGPGFPQPIEPLFEKFARGVDGDGRAPGVGLGLTIAKGFAEAQGGRIEARNRKPGSGACVRLLLPLAEARQAG
jgi:two-component system sensor histidine kinase KdpD